MYGFDTRDSFGHITIEFWLVVLISGQEPKIYGKRWFSLVSKNLISDYGPDPVLIHSCLTKVGLLFLQESLSIDTVYFDYS